MVKKYLFSTVKLYILTKRSFSAKGFNCEKKWVQSTTLKSKLMKRFS